MNKSIEVILKGHSNGAVYEILFPRPLNGFNFDYGRNPNEPLSHEESTSLYRQIVQIVIDNVPDAKEKDIKIKYSR